ncbi:MAG: hypothetical protein V3T17_19230 [Pseudomonadales bacterium]
MADNRNDSEADDDEKEKALQAKIELFGAEYSRQMWIAILFIPLMLIAFLVGVLSLSSAVKTADLLLAVKPENRAGLFANRIEKVNQKVRDQYAVHVNKMDDESIYTVNRKFELLYELSLESEKDYGILLDTYQKSIYQIASKVRGSGEWYFYYDRKLKQLIDSNKRRQLLMSRYFQEE